MKWIVGMVVVLLLAGSAYADLSAWVMGGDELLNARIGYVKGDIEVGAQAYWDRGEELAPPQIYGVYGCYFLPDLIDTNTPLGIDWLPEKIRGRPYIGAQVSLGTAEDQRYLAGPIAGLQLVDLLTIEYQYVAYSDTLDAIGDEHRVMFGMRIQF